MVCTSYNNPDIKDGNTPRENRTKSWIGIWSAEYNYFDPILDMDKVLEFVTPSHSGIEWLDGPQEEQALMNTNAQLFLTINW